MNFQNLLEKLFCLTEKAGANELNLLESAAQQVKWFLKTSKTTHEIHE